MKVFNYICIVLFIISAGLQYNDPDPYLWMPLYLYPAWLCYRALQGKFNLRLYLIAYVVCAGYALYLFFDSSGVLNWLFTHDAESIVQSMEPSKPWIEETREFGGLLIILVVLVINHCWLKKRTT